MSYITHPEKHGDIVINLDGIRFVQEVRANLAGGAPRSDLGRITYLDGHILEVSRGCAKAVQAVLIEITPEPKESADE